MKKIKLFMVAAALVLGGAFVMVSAPEVMAQNALQNACEVDPTATICQNEDDDAGSLIEIIVNTLLFIVGLISVIMIIFGGIRYATSAGDSSAVTAAKNTILYAIIGLVVSFIAFAIVNWVLQVF